MTYLRYAPEIEQREDDEQATIDGIITGMTQQSDVVEKREHHAVRASHAKSSGCVIGEMTIAQGLPPELAQGLFATPGTHPVAIRFAQGPGEKRWVTGFQPIAAWRSRCSTSVARSCRTTHRRRRISYWRRDRHFPPAPRAAF